VVGGGLQAWRFEWVQCAFDAPITALSYDQRDGTLWLGNAQALNVQYPNLDFDRLGALQGLPYGTCGAVRCCSLLCSSFASQ
jgi:hypothetical protein